MKLLFVVGHPAHVHLFKNAIQVLRQRGHLTRVIAVEKETTIRLLDHYQLTFQSLGRSLPSIAGKALDLPAKVWRFLRNMSADRPDMVVSTGSPYAAQASAILSIPHIAFSDTEIASAVLRLMVPFTDTVCTPSCFSLDLGPKHVRYNGYKELAYLHPSRFRPDPHVLDLLGLEPSDRIIVIRFSSLDSSHDLGVRGLGFRSDADLMEFVNRLESYGRVVVTSERRLPKGLDGAAPKIPVHMIHDLLYFATLYVGEGATMAAEAGVLGTPWIFASIAGRGFLDDQQKQYGLGFRETSASAALGRAESVLSMPGLKGVWGKKRDIMLREKIDVTSFIVKTLEEWPEIGKANAIVGSVAQMRLGAE